MSEISTQHAAALATHHATLTDELANREHGRALEKMGAAHHYGVARDNNSSDNKVSEIKASANADVTRHLGKAEADSRVIGAKGAAAFVEHGNAMHKSAAEHGQRMEAADQAHGHAVASLAAKGSQERRTVTHKAKYAEGAPAPRARAASPVKAAAAKPSEAPDTIAVHIGSAPGASSPVAAPRKAAATIAPSAPASEHLKAPTLGAGVKVTRAEVSEMAGSMGANKTTGRPKPSAKKAPNVSPQFSH